MKLATRSYREKQLEQEAKRNASFQRLKQARDEAERTAEIRRRAKSRLTWARRAADSSEDSA
jgi:hypothetical protein